MRKTKDLRVGLDIYHYKLLRLKIIKLVLKNIIRQVICI